MGEVLGGAELIHGTDTLLGSCLLHRDKATAQELLSTVQIRAVTLAFVRIFIVPELAYIVVIEFAHPVTVFVVCRGSVEPFCCIAHFVIVELNRPRPKIDPW